MADPTNNVEHDTGFSMGLGPRLQRHPLAKEVLKQLLDRTRQPSMSELEDDDCCHICHDAFLEGETPELPIKLPCGHICGVVCVLKWLDPLTRHGRNTCPECRKPILEVEDNFIRHIIRFDEAEERRMRAAQHPRPRMATLVAEQEITAAEQQLERARDYERLHPSTDAPAPIIRSLEEQLERAYDARRLRAAQTQPDPHLQQLGRESLALSPSSPRTMDSRTVSDTTSHTGTPGLAQQPTNSTLATGSLGQSQQSLFGTAPGATPSTSPSSGQGPIFGALPPNIAPTRSVFATLSMTPQIFPESQNLETTQNVLAASHNVPGPRFDFVFTQASGQNAGHSRSSSISMPSTIAMSDHATEESQQGSQQRREQEMHQHVDLVADEAAQQARQRQIESLPQLAIPTGGRALLWYEFLETIVGTIELYNEFIASIQAPVAQNIIDMVTLERFTNPTRNLRETATSMERTFPRLCSDFVSRLSELVSIPNISILSTLELERRQAEDSGLGAPHASMWSSRLTKRIGRMSPMLIWFASESESFERDWALAGLPPLHTPAPSEQGSDASSSPRSLRPNEAINATTSSRNQTILGQIAGTNVESTEEQLSTADVNKAHGESLWHQLCSSLVAYVEASPTYSTWLDRYTLGGMIIDMVTLERFNKKRARGNVWIQDLAQVVPEAFEKVAEFLEGESVGFKLPDEGTYGKVAEWHRRMAENAPEAPRDEAGEEVEENVEGFDSARSEAGYEPEAEHGEEEEL